MSARFEWDLSLLNSLFKCFSVRQCRSPRLVLVLPYRAHERIQIAPADGRSIFEDEMKKEARADGQCADRDHENDARKFAHGFGSSA